MKQVLNNNVRDEIFEIRDRIRNTQNAYIKQYCVKAPLDLQKDIFIELLAIDQKVNSYKFITDSSIEYFEFVKSKFNYKKIVGKLKRIVEKLQNNYYYDLVDYVDNFIYGLSLDEVMQPVKNELEELENFLRIKSYIQKHKEYRKIADFMEWVKCVSEIHYERGVYHTYRMLGIKETLTRYEKHLNDVLTVEDINLKRAVFAYLDNDVEFGFVDSL